MSTIGEPSAMLYSNTKGYILGRTEELAAEHDSVANQMK